MTQQLTPCEQSVIKLMNLTIVDTLPPEVLGWIKFLCFHGEPAEHIAKELLLELEWLRWCKAIKNMFPSIPDADLIEIKASFKKGELKPDDVITEAQRRMPPPPLPPKKIRPK